MLYIQRGPSSEVTGCLPPLTAHTPVRKPGNPSTDHGLRAAHHAHVCARVKLRAALLHNDVARDDALPAIHLHAQVLGQRLAP